MHEVRAARAHVNPSAARIKLLRLPSLMYNASGIPPFGVATIAATLRAAGYWVEPDDLDARCAGALFPANRWGADFPARDMMRDIARVWRHLEGPADGEITALVDSILALTDLDADDVVLLSCVEGDDAAAALALCIGQRVRRQAALVVMGGEAFPHMQPIKDRAAEAGRLGCFDHYIQGYGETPLLALFERLESGAPLRDVPGLLWTDGDGRLHENAPCFTRPEVLPDFDGLPMELYGRAGEDEPEGASTAAKLLILPFKLSYGCPNRCAFCIESGQAFRKVTTLEPSIIVEGLRRAMERHGTRYFIFYDHIFNVRRSFAEAVAEALIDAQLGALWSDCAYAARGLDAELLRKLHAAGARRLVWGLETASPSLLRSIDKKLHVEDLERALRWSHDAGVYNAVEIIAGLPHETEDDVEATLDFLRRNRDWLDQVFLNPFSLVTGSSMHREPARYGIESIQPIATLFDERPDPTYSWIQRYTFDERGGLAWPAKLEQIEASYRRVREAMLELELGGHDLHTIFHLYEKHGEKRNVTAFQSSRRHQGFDYFGEEGAAHVQAGARTAARRRG